MTPTPGHADGAGHDFDQGYWAQVWEGKDRSTAAGTMSTSPTNPPWL